MCAATVSLMAADPFFGIDGAMTWLASGKREAHRKQLIQQLQDNGIATLRERLTWGALNPEPGKFQYPAGYDAIRQLCRDAGIAVLDLYHDAPGWTGANGRETPYPLQLPAARDAWRRFAERWADSWCGWEIWNEPDIGFGGDLPFDQYHVLLKTVNLAAGDSPVTLVGIVSAREMPEAFHRAAAANGAFELVDAVSFHSYNSSLMLEGAIAAQQKVMGDSPRPLWLTESGFSFPIEKGKEPEPAGLHTSAWHIVIKAVEAKAAGVARNYPFVFSNYHEGPFSFSMLDPDLKPYPSLTAYFAAIRQLSGKRYVGDLRLPGSTRARVFADAAGNAVAVIAAGESGGTLPPLPVSGQLFDLYGNAVETLPTGLVYLALPLAEAEPVLERDTPMARLNAWSERAGRTRRRPAAPLVIQPLAVRELFYKINSSGYFLNPEPGKRVTVPVRVWNLGAQPAAISLDAVATAGGRELGRFRFAAAETAAPDQFAQFAVELPLGDWLAEHDRVEVELSAAAGDVHDRTVLVFLRNRIEQSVATGAAAAPREVGFGADENWMSLGALRHGPADLDAKFRAVWTPELLTFTVTVTDNVQMQNFPPAQFWMGDSLQLAIRALPGRGKETAQFCVAQNEAGQAAVYVDRKLPESVRPEPAAVAVVRNGNTTQYTLSLQPETLGLTHFAAGNRFGLSLFVNDNDGYGRKGGLAWGDGIARYNGNPSVYYHLTLE